MSVNDIWKPAVHTGTEMKQKAYEELAKSGHVMTEEEAKKLINEEFGFELSRIDIIKEAKSYEVNEAACRLRVAETYQREPVYEATDWYYVRFNVRGNCTWQWEAIDGELYEYCT